MMLHFVGMKLGMTISHLKKSMSYSEFIDWLTFFEQTGEIKRGDDKPIGNTELIAKMKAIAV